MCQGARYRGFACNKISSSFKTVITLSSVRTKPNYLLSIPLINSHIVARERARQKADQSYIRPAKPEDTTLTPLIYDEHPNLFTRILLQVDISATLLGKVSAPNKCVTYRLQEDRCTHTRGTFLKVNPQRPP